MGASSSYLSTATYSLQNQKVISHHLSSSHLSTATYILQNQKRLVIISHHHISPLLLTHYKIKTWSVIISHRHISPLLLTFYKIKGGQSSSLIIVSLRCYLQRSSPRPRLVLKEA